MLRFSLPGWLRAFGVTGCCGGSACVVKKAYAFPQFSETPTPWSACRRAYFLRMAQELQRQSSRVPGEPGVVTSRVRRKAPGAPQPGLSKWPQRSCWSTGTVVSGHYVASPKMPEYAHPSNDDQDHRAGENDCGILVSHC